MDTRDIRPTRTRRLRHTARALRRKTKSLEERNALAESQDLLLASAVECGKVVSIAAENNSSAGPLRAASSAEIVEPLRRNSLTPMPYPVLGPDIQQSYSIVERWAIDVIKGCLGSRDPKTLDIWAKSAGTSRTMIAQRCRMLNIKPQRAKDLTRAIYAMVHGHRKQCQPFLFLDIADQRTLKSFQRHAGVHFQSTDRITGISGLLNTQTFIDCENHGIVVLGTRLNQLFLSDAPSAFNVACEKARDTLGM